MNRTLFRTLTWLMWVALPLMALRFWMVWDQLPATMATHFNANWQANGWMSRPVAFEFAIGIIAFVLLVFTVILLVASRQKQSTVFPWVMLAFSYFVVSFVYFGNDKVVTYNLTRQSPSMNWWLLLLPPALVIFTGFYIQSTRGDQLPDATPIADEVDGSPLFGALIMIAGAGLLLAAMSGQAAFRIGALLMFAILFITGAAAWSGFHYLFSNHGLEIRTLGFRLRSIPAAEIENYSVGSWSLLRGYGIRGVGDSRAYVWGNKVVQIKTTQGTVVLSHSHPEKLLRDLDLVTHGLHEMKK
jgi:hypothetical protein